MNDEPIEVETRLVYQNPHAHARGYFHFSRHRKLWYNLPMKHHLIPVLLVFAGVHAATAVSLSTPHNRAA